MIYQVGVLESSLWILWLKKSPCWLKRKLRSMDESLSLSLASQGNGRAKTRNYCVEKKSGKCCACAMTGTCRRCSCAVRRVPCSGCVPSKYSRCLNGGSASLGNQLEDQSSESVGNTKESEDNAKENVQARDSSSEWLHEKFVGAFGGSLLCSGGDVSFEKWYIWWKSIGFVIWKSL